MHLICAALNWLLNDGIAPPPAPFVTKSTTRLYSGFASSRFGPTLPFQPASARVWQAEHGRLDTPSACAAGSPPPPPPPVVVPPPVVSPPPVVWPPPVVVSPPPPPVVVPLAPLGCTTVWLVPVPTVIAWVTVWSTGVELKQPEAATPRASSESRASRAFRRIGDDPRVCGREVRTGGSVTA